MTKSAKIELIRKLRWRARTDLLFLCNNVLGYTLVNEEVHGPILGMLQKFPVPSDDEALKHDQFDLKTGVWRYRPIKPLTALLCTNRNLILDPRGFYKTSVNTMAHTIQWVLNYPDVAIAIIQSNGEKAAIFLDEIKQHFKYNETFRELFPEHVPQRAIEDWGTKEALITEARSRGTIRREPTILATALDKGGAGLHVDVMKFSDIVEPKNSQTRDQCAKVYRQFVQWQNVLVGPRYWIDVEGTRYDFSDAYGRIIETELERRKKQGDAYQPLWRMHIRSCYLRKYADDEARTYDVEDLSRPYVLDENGQYISIFPEHKSRIDPATGKPELAFPTSSLEELRAADPETFACQQLNNPNDWAESVPFPLTLFTTKTRHEYRQHAKIAYHTTTIDTAETVSRRSKYSAITTVGWDAFGRGWVHDIRHGKMLPDDLIKEIFAVYAQHRPRTIIIEDTSFVRGLMAAINRQIQLGVSPQLPLRFVRRENDVAKTERILNTLQPYYKRGELYFLDDLPCLDHLKNEFSRFPKFEYTDILDTLADQFTDREWFGRNRARSRDIEVPRDDLERIQQMAFKEMAGILTDKDLDLAHGRGYRNPGPAPNLYYHETGGL